MVRSRPLRNMCALAQASPLFKVTKKAFGIIWDSVYVYTTSTSTTTTTTNTTTTTRIPDTKLSEFGMLPDFKCWLLNSDCNLRLFL